ncbi:MAG: YbaK/EbsC family protein [Anaerolineales bacterium]|nr:YbaK/EbsC family protein [Anaerolineales bacterium]
MSKLSSSARRVQDALDQLGLVLQVVELPNSTRTAADAAQAIGCTAAQIAKSLIFSVKESDRPVMVIASGINRVNEKSIASILGEKIGKADADFVRQRTGFVIGGVPPVGHIEQVETFLDEDLLQYDEIWAAAGTPHAVFRLTPDDLIRATGGKVISIH